MSKFQVWLEENVSGVAFKIQQNRFVSAIMNGLMSMLPITIIGSMFSLFGALPIDAYQAFLQSSGLSNVFTIVTTSTTGLFSVFAVFFLSRNIVNSFDLDGTIAGAIALVMFIIVTPFELMNEASLTVLPFTWLGAQGLFTAIIVAIVSSLLYVTIIKRNLTIKMPEGTPENISKSFASLIPGLLIALVFALFNVAFKNTSYGNVHSFIYGVISTPLSALTNSFISFLLVNIFMNLLWMFGIHGALVGLSVMMPFWLAADFANQALFAAGQPLNNTTGFAFWMSYGTVAIIGMVAFMAFFAKSKRYRTLGKMALPASICGINEPSLFGIPMVLNPVFLIPMLVIPTIQFIVAYILQSIGLVAIPAGFVLPLGIPVFVSGFMQGSWTIALLQLAFIISGVVMFYPFFNIMDKRAAEEEKTTI